MVTHWPEPATCIILQTTGRQKIKKMSVYAPMTDYIWELVKSRGIDPAPIFTKAGLDPGTRRNINDRVPRARFDRLILLAAEASGDSAFGLRATVRFHPSHFGALGYSWMTSSSLRSAVNKFLQYSRLLGGLTNISLREDGTNAKVEIVWPVDIRTSHIVQISLALMVHMFRLILGDDFCPIQMRFRDKQPGNIKPFDDHFRCTLKFSASSDGIVFPADLLDRPLPRAHAELSRLHNEAITRYLAQRDKSDIVSQSKAAIFELIAEGRVTAKTVAGQLNMSTRTLRRRLDDQGIGFRELLSEQRREMALKYIQDESLTLTEISYLLGFAEPSSFSRAYKGWTGISPTTARSSEAA